MRLINRAITQGICNLARHFRKDELAFLLLAGKSEILLRDSLAFSLQEKLGHGFLVRREWKRVDLAILDGQKNRLALVECKAMATFDCTRSGRKRTEYPEKMYKDLHKISRLAKKNTSLYAILFAVHPLDPVGGEVLRLKLVKYASGMNRALEKHPAADVLKICDRTIKRFFRAKRLRASLCAALHAGECFDVRVKAPCWIVGPLKKAQLAKH